MTAWYMMASSISEGGIVALKMMGGVAAAAVILYLVIMFSRVLGSKIEDKKYQAYCEKYRAEHQNEEGMLTKEAFIESRLQGGVGWKRDEGQSARAIEAKAEGDTTPPSEHDEVLSSELTSNDATEEDAGAPREDSLDAMDPDTEE